MDNGEEGTTRQDDMHVFQHIPAPRLPIPHIYSRYRSRRARAAPVVLAFRVAFITYSVICIVQEMHKTCLLRAAESEII